MSGMSPLPALPVPKKLCALDELAVKRDYPGLIPVLYGYGLSMEDAVATAYNTTLVYYAMGDSVYFSSPGDVLTDYSLEEIAQICEKIAEITETDYECGFNASYREEGV